MMKHLNSFNNRERKRWARVFYRPANNAIIAITHGGDYIVEYSGKSRGIYDTRREAESAAMEFVYD